ncbi:hypothetical protein JCM10213_001332 [Rhodosporidiobolus nylandii]
MAALQTQRGDAPSSTDSSTVAHSRFCWLILALVGQHIEATLKGGIRVRGILAAATPAEGDLSLSLRQAVYLTGPSAAAGEVKTALLVNGRDLLEIDALDVVVDLFAGSGSGEGAAQKQDDAIKLDNGGEGKFRTDTDISGGRLLGQGRQLQAWGGGLEDDSLEGGIGDLSLSNGGGGGGGGRKGGPPAGWDQFAANERQFGLKTDYDDEIYTTKLDRSGKDFRAREAKAAQLEREILKGSSASTLASNAHMAEERGEQLPDLLAGTNEEDRYGAVIRSEGAYVPPGARKAALARLSQQGAPAPGAKAPSPGPPAGGARLPPTARIPPTSSSSSAAAASPAPVPSSTPSAAAPAVATSASQQTAAAGGTVDQKFRDFVTDERKRLEAKKAQLVQQAQRKENDSKLASLLQWSQTFKNPYPLPDDLATILGKKPASSVASASTTTGAPSSGQQAPVEKASASAATSPSTSTRPLPPAAAAAPVQPKKPLASKPLIAEIPPFNPQKAKQRQAEIAALKAGLPSIPSSVAGGSGEKPAPKEDKAALQPKPPAEKKKLSATAGAFVFKPNPAAASFTPGGAPAAAKASPAASPAVAAAAPPSAPSPAPVASTSTALNPNANPFFGPSPIRGSSSSTLRVKEDFTPFLRGSSTSTTNSSSSSSAVRAALPSPETVSPGWAFSGKPYKAMYPPQAGPLSAADAQQQHAQQAQQQQQQQVQAPPPPPPAVQIPGMPVQFAPGAVPPPPPQGQVQVPQPPVSVSQFHPHQQQQGGRFIPPPHQQQRQPHASAPPQQQQGQPQVPPHLAAQMHAHHQQHQQQHQQQQQAGLPQGVQFIPGVGAVMVGPGGVVAGVGGGPPVQFVPGQPGMPPQMMPQGMMGMQGMQGMQAMGQMGMPPQFAGQGPMFTSPSLPHPQHPGHAHSPAPHQHQHQHQHHPQQRGASMPPWAPFTGGQQQQQPGGTGPGTPTMMANPPLPPASSAGPPPPQAGAAQGMPPQFIQPPPPQAAS